jgi:hypothetical protein
LWGHPSLFLSSDLVADRLTHFGALLLLPTHAHAHAHDTDAEIQYAHVTSGSFK